MKSRFLQVIVSAFVSALAATTLLAADWPHWLGPNGDNIAPDAGGFEADLSRWKTAWKSNVGRGYSSVIVAGGRAYTLGHDGTSQETVFCCDAASGAVAWKFAYDAQLIPQMHPGGPNASPTVIGGKVITVSKDGQVFCLTADKGGKLWQANLMEILGIKLPQWGVASSPVIHKGQVLLGAGKVAALDLETGKTAWTSTNADPPGYTTPVVFALDGKEFVAALNAKGFSVLSAKDGQEVAKHPFRANFDVVAPTPMILAQGRRIFIAGNARADMLGFDGQKLTAIWTSTQIKNALNNSVPLEGTLYGIDGAQDSPNARFVSVNADDGKLNWAKESFGYGNVIGVGKMLLGLTESGELVTIKAAPGAYNEISRLPVLGKKCWTTPVYADGRIYVRNDAGEVVCLTVK